MVENPSKPYVLNECMTQITFLISEGEGTLTNILFWTSEIIELNNVDKESQWGGLENLKQLKKIWTTSFLIKVRSQDRIS